MRNTRCEQMFPLWNVMSEKCHARTYWAAANKSQWPGMPLRSNAPHSVNLSPARRRQDRLHNWPRRRATRSVPGQSLPKWDVRATSAFPLLATEALTSRNVSNVPQRMFGTGGRDGAIIQARFGLTVAHPRQRRIKTNSRGKKPAKLGGSHGPFSGPCLIAAEPCDPV